MSGPPYPPAPPPGSNAFGEFTFGVSPFGTIKSLDPFRTIISQYANSPILNKLIENFDSYVDPTQNLDNFYDSVWNIDTAVGWGLDVWGRIVGVNRIIPVTGVGIFFGFDQGVGGGLIDSFGQAPFFSGAPLTSNVSLMDPAFRTLIFAKALANISSGTIPAINQLLLNLFSDRGNCYVTDGLDMTMTYTFAFPLSPVELAIVSRANLLPKPTGVAVSVVTP